MLGLLLLYKVYHKRRIVIKIQIIVGSTRQERVSNRLALWVESEAKKIAGAEVETVDLSDYVMPLFSEAISPQYNPNRVPSPEVKKWLEKIAEADAFIIVTPEYNRSTSGVLKNALDYIDFQFENKPVALVAHGTTGGAQAVSHLRGIIPGLQTVTIPKAVYFAHRVGEVIDEKGNLSEEIKANPYGPQAALTATLDSLKWYSEALLTARKKS